jgi:hypothetical protein
MTFCGGIKEMARENLKKKNYIYIYIFVDEIYKKHSLKNSGTAVLYIGHLMPKG